MKKIIFFFNEIITLSCDRYQLKNREALNKGEDDMTKLHHQFIEKARQSHRLGRMKRNKLGMMRYLYILIDCSESMSMLDLKPSRLQLTLEVIY